MKMNFKIEKHRDTHREMKLTREDRCEDNFSWDKGRQSVIRTVDIQKKVGIKGIKQMLLRKTST